MRNGSSTEREERARQQDRGKQERQQDRKRDKLARSGFLFLVWNMPKASAGQVGKREGLRACRSWEGKPERSKASRS